MISERDQEIFGGERAFRDYRLETFKPSEKTAAAFAAAKDFSKTIDNLYFFGPAGTGKTHLAIATARTAPVRYFLTIKPMELARRVRAEESASGEGRVIRRYAEAPVLVIDDLGIEKMTEFMASVLYEVIDWRYMNQPSGLIVTSNIGLDGLAARVGDDRIPSRLAQMTKRHSFVGEQDHRIIASDKRAKQ